MASYTAADGSTSLKSCSDFVTAVNTDFGADLPNVQKYLVASVDPDAAEAGMNAQEANVSGVVATAIGSSQDAMTIIKQAVTRNMLNDSLKGYMGTSTGVLGATMAELQTQNTQRLLGVVAEKAVVNLKIVIELLFIGIFPVIFPLFLLPKLGPAMAKGYLAGFFYLQLWGPMYVILHKVMMANAYVHTASATFGAGNTHVFNALTLDAAAQANQDVCTLAGSMMLMIPVLAGLLTKGAMAVGAQGEALLGNFRSGAESASSSLTSGNWSLGNTAIENHSWSNESANQHVTSRYDDRSRSTTVGADGVTLTRYNSGLTIVNAGVSSGALDLARQEGYSESLSRTSQSYLDDSRSLTDAISVGKTRSKTVMDEVFRGWSNNTVNLSGMSSEEQASTGRVISDLQGLSRYYQTSHHMSKSEADAEATRAGVTAYAQAEAGGDVGFASAKAGVKGEASKDASTTATQAKSNDQGFSLTQSLSTEIADTHNRISTDAARSAYDRSQSSDYGQRYVDSSSFSSLESITDTATRLRATGTRLSEDATNVKNGSESVSGNEGTAFFNWMIQEKGLPVADARRIWIGANAADLDHGMALAQEYNNQQAQSLAAKYDAAATPAKADIPLMPDLVNAEKVTNALSDRSDLRPAPVQPSAKPARSGRKRRPATGGAEPQPQTGWQPQAPSLDGGPQAAAFTQRNAAAATTTDTVNQAVAHGETTLENQQVREHINITDQGKKTLGKVGDAAVKTWNAAKDITGN
jgi:conjugal transfer mating pair stabilization protein TraG